MKRIVFVLLLCLPLFSFAQSSVDIKDVANFPEDYVGKTITFKNIYWWPQLYDIKDKVSEITYYRIDINVSGDPNRTEWKFGSMQKIAGVVTKPIAKKLTADGKSGLKSFYLGDVTGKVIKANFFGNDYFFVITKIVSKDNAGNITTTYTN